MKIKKSLILKEATEIKSFIEKNHKIPKSCTLADGTILSPYSVTFLMSSLIHNLNSTSYGLTNVIIYDSNKHVDTINEKVQKEDYLKMINNFINYCKNHKRVPSYITTTKSEVKVSFELYMYCLSKMLVFYQKNKALPNHCEFNKSDLTVKQTTTKNTKTTSSSSTSTTKKTATSSKNTVKATVKKISKYVQTNLLENIGCKGRGQCTPYYCSCNALQQMFYRLTGILVPEKTIAKWAGVTTNGVGHAGIETAVAKFNKTYKKNLKITWKNFSDFGKTTKERFKNLCEIITNPKMAIFFHLLYRLLYGHYEPIKAIDMDSEMLEILNSLGTKNNDGTYQGYVEKRSFGTQQSYISGITQKSVCIISA